MLRRLAGCLIAVAEEVGCPAQIVTAQSLTKAAPGWTERKDASPNVLAGLTFYDGRPEEQASLAPDEKHVKGKLVETWELFPNLDVPFLSEAIKASL